MKSARSSKSLKLVLSLTAIVSFAPIASAQQDSGYAPPPMFDDLTPPMVRPQTHSGNIVEPMSSPKTVLPPDGPHVKPVIVPRVSVDPNSIPAPAPTPPPVPGSVTTTTTIAPAPQQPVVSPAKPKMMQPIIEPHKAAPKVKKPEVKKPEVKKPEITPPKPVTKPEIKKPVVKEPEAKKVDVPVTPVAPTPPAPVVKKEEPKAETPPQPAPIMPEPAKRDPSISAIKGPKTMPALPTEEIAKQKTFESKTPAVETETMLERRQKEVAAEKEKTIEPVVAAPKPNVAPASFDKNQQGALKKSIAFTQGQIGLSSEEIDPIAVAVNNELGADDKEDWRVQIRAYATPYGTGVSSDKRIALSRALSLRTALIAQGVPAARIDVLAEGLQSDNPKQPDRIDLYMYGPAAD